MNNHSDWVWADEAEFRDYWAEVRKYVLYKPEDIQAAAVFGFFEEVGELSKIFARYLRDKEAINFDSLVKELGDVAFYLAMGAFSQPKPLTGIALILQQSLVDSTLHDTYIDVKAWAELFTALCAELDVPVAKVLDRNRGKLAKRAMNNALRGHGDER